MLAKIIFVMLIAVSKFSFSQPLIPREYSDPDGKIYLCWDTLQVSYIAAMIDNGLRNDSIIQALLIKIGALEKDVTNLESQVANLEKDQSLGNQQAAILQEALTKANRLIKWLKLKANIFIGTTAAILLYSLTIGAQK